MTDEVISGAFATFMAVTEQPEINRRIMQAFKDAEEARLRLLGALAILVEDEIISSGRARELGAMTIEEQRAYLRGALK